MMIELKGVQFVNKGAELMLHAMLQQLQNLDTELEICMQPNHNSPYVKRARIGAFQRMQLRKNILDLNGLSYLLPRAFRQKLKNKYGIVFEADVDMVLDASGFAYGDQWSDLVLQQVSGEVARLKAKGKHYVFMPQSLGPFTRDKNKAAAKKAFTDASLVFAREQPSFEHVNALTDNPSVYRAPDFTNLVQATLPEQYAFCKDAVLIIPNSKMLSTKNSDTRWQQHYIPLLTALGNAALERGEQLVILNHSGHDDKALCEQINNGLNQAVEIIEPADALAVKAVIGNSKGIICSRFHGCVSALSQGIPCLATGWSHKYRELFTEYESSAYLLQPDDSDTVIEDAIQLLLKPDVKYQARLNEKGTEYKAQSKAMWQKVLELMKVSP